MSKKSKKELQAMTAVAAAVSATTVEPDSFPEPQFRLVDMQATTRAHFDNKAWADILALGRVPLTAIHEDDRKDAEVWQLRATIVGLYPPGVQSIYNLPTAAREEFDAALEQLAARVSALHTLPEFDLYLESKGWSMTAAQKRSGACRVPAWSSRMSIGCGSFAGAR